MPLHLPGRCRTRKVIMSDMAICNPLRRYSAISFYGNKMDFFGRHFVSIELSFGLGDLRASCFLESPPLGGSVSNNSIANA